MHRRQFTSVLLLALAAALFAGPSSLEAAKSPRLDSWIEKDLTPYISRQLTTHPRFKGELVRFVIFKNGNPTPTSNELAVSLRNQLADAIIDVPGVRVGWPKIASNTRRDQSAIDCSKDTVHYYIGLEVSDVANGQHRVELRALDLEDRSWVAGLAQSWHGELSRSEQRAFQRAASDNTFRGQRSVPFSDDQPDLLAAHLAHDLGCALLRQVSAEYLVALETDEDGSVPMDGVVELVSNNLAAYRALQVAADIENANAVLRGKAHHVVGDLYQYWITVAPTDPSTELPPISASAYVHLPQLHAGRKKPNKGKKPPVDAAVFSPGIKAPIDANVLSSTRIVKLRSADACSSGGVSFQDRFNDCFAMQVRTKEDAVIFVLNHQLNHGLVRLSGHECSQRTEARIVRADESLEYTLPIRFLTQNASSPSTDWPINPDAEVYYAIAVSNSKVARALSRQLSQLPRRCSQSIRPGLKGVRLESWLNEFSATVDQWQPYVDWQAIRVRNVL